METVDVICMTCGHLAPVAARQVTATLMCSCGSDDLDLYIASAEQRRVAGKEPVHQPPPTLPGWNEYAGPQPGQNTSSNGVPTPITCPVCKGSGYDSQDGMGGKCRTCHGKGVYTPMTDGEPPMVARHDYPSTQTQVPFMGSPGRQGSRRTADAKALDNPFSPEYQMTKGDPAFYTRYGPARPRAQTKEMFDAGIEAPFNPENKDTFYPQPDHVSPAVNYREHRDYSVAPDKPFAMAGSSCPFCSHEPMELHKDENEDAWATCPHCGPIYNVDRNPDVDPYALRYDFSPPKQKFKAPKTGGRHRRVAVRKTGRILSIVASITKTNPGVSPREAVTLARRTVARY